MKHCAESPLPISFRRGVVGIALAALALAGCGEDTGGEATAPPPPSCPAEREEAIGPVEKVSEGEVLVVSEMDGAKTLYVDASAGGAPMQADNPWIYLNLASASRVDVTDTQADTSAAWDVAMKRPVIRTNSGDGGPGDGGAAFLKEKAFDAVTDADAAAATIATERWFDNACVVKLDAGGYTATTFDGWYDYGGQTTHTVTPHPGVFIVRGGDGALYKVEFMSYYANPDGTAGMASGRFLLRYAPVAK